MALSPKALRLTHILTSVIVTANVVLIIQMVASSGAVDGSVGGVFAGLFFTVATVGYCASIAALARVDPCRWISPRGGAQGCDRMEERERGRVIRNSTTGWSIRSVGVVLAIVARFETRHARTPRRHPAESRLGRDCFARHTRVSATIRGALVACPSSVESVAGAFAGDVSSRRTHPPARRPTDPREQQTVRRDHGRQEQQA